MRNKSTIVWSGGVNEPVLSTKAHNGEVKQRSHVTFGGPEQITPTASVPTRYSEVHTRSQVTFNGPDQFDHRSLVERSRRAHETDECLTHVRTTLEANAQKASVCHRAPRSVGAMRCLKSHAHESLRWPRSHAALARPPPAVLSVASSGYCEPHMFLRRIRATACAFPHAPLVTLIDCSHEQRKNPYSGLNQRSAVVLSDASGTVPPTSVTGVR